MEGDRKSYADEVQNVVRKQKAQIEKLKRENGGLKSELELQSRAASFGESGVVSTRMTILQDSTDQMTRSIEAEKRKAEELDNRLKGVRDCVMSERRDMGGNNAPQEQNQAVHKQIKVLEHRLHRGLVKFNEAIAANKDLREEIDNLRRECARPRLASAAHPPGQPRARAPRLFVAVFSLPLARTDAVLARGRRVVFDGIYKKLQHELGEKKRKMAEIIEVANVAYEARDRAQAEIQGLKLLAEKEQSDFEGEWKELGHKLEEDRKRQDFLARERQRLLATEQRGDMSMEDEANLKKVVTKGHWNLAKDKATIQAGMEKVQSYEEAFAKIQARRPATAPLQTRLFPSLFRAAHPRPRLRCRPASRCPLRTGGDRHLRHRPAGEALHRERGPELQDVQLPQRAERRDREGRGGYLRAQAGVGEVPRAGQGCGLAAQAAHQGSAGPRG
jgi:hypothetical protein